MLAQFSIWPLDNPHLSKDIAAITEILGQIGVRYKVNAMSTTVEGEWQNVMDAIHACHEVTRNAHMRVHTSIDIDDDATRALNMAEATAKVEARQQESKP
jgi:uncharacterized protein (TIGR00106 family)